MMDFFETLRERNSVLFWFGLVNLVAALIFLLLSKIAPMEISGANGWYKPIKFTLSTALLVWAVGWYSGYLTAGRDLDIVNWGLVILLGFEILYIGIQAARGEMSHFNLSTPFYRSMWSLMALAATGATLLVGYVGLRFASGDFPELPDYYLWSIRLGILIFVVFSFEGFVMGANLSHTIGGPDGGAGLPFLNWSRTFGDPRVAHFIGMHALQVIPLLSWYALRNVSLTVLVSFLYGALAVWTLVQALSAKPLIPG